MPSSSRSIDDRDNQNGISIGRTIDMLDDSLTLSEPTSLRTSAFLPSRRRVVRAFFSMKERWISSSTWRMVLAEDNVPTLFLVGCLLQVSCPCLFVLEQKQSLALFVVFEWKKFPSRRLGYRDTKQRYTEEDLTNGKEREEFLLVPSLSLNSSRSSRTK